MAAIGAIRKHGVLLMIIIGFALLAFIVGDFTNLTALFSDRNTMARINRENLNDQYTKEYRENIARYKLLYDKQTLEEYEEYNIHSETWEELVESKLLDEQLTKLGLQFSQETVEKLAEEMITSLQSNQPYQELVNLANILVKYYPTANPQEVFESFEEYSGTENTSELYDAYMSIRRKYISNAKKIRYYGMAYGAMYFSDKMVEQVAKKDKSTMASLVRIDPNSPAFNDVTPSIDEKEMKKWYKDHKKSLYFAENLRDIDVALFPVNPTDEDLKTIEDSVKAEFQRFTLASSLLEFNAAEEKGVVDTNFYSADDLEKINKNIQIADLDSLIFKCPVGSFIEPATEQNNFWYYGKVFGSEMRPDSILVAALIVDYNTPNSSRTKKQARSESDSLNLLIQSGADIFQLLPNYLAGRPATDTTYWYIEHSTPLNIYNELVHTNIGGTYIDKIEHAYVVYQVLEKTQLIDKRQFALYFKEIVPSEQTVKSIRNSATTMASTVTSADALIDAANAQGIQVLKGTNVRSMDAVIAQQLPNCREIVNWAFNKDVKVDNVSDVMSLNNNKFFAVAAVRNIREKGNPKFDAVKKDIENILKVEKKTEMVAQAIDGEMAKGNTMESLASKYNSTVEENVQLSFLDNRNIEDIAIARIFNMSANSSKAIAGKNTVYLVKVGEFTDNQPSANYDREKQILTYYLGFRSMNVLEGLRNSIMSGLTRKAKILDQRHLFYQK